MMDQTIGGDPAIRHLYRARQERLLLGVSGGVARYADLDPTIVRVIWVLATLATGPGAILAYIILAALIPNEPAEAPAI